MNKVSFGVKSLSKPTPPILHWIFGAVAFLSGIWALLPPELLHISKDVVAEVNHWIIISNSIMLFTIKFFGLDYKKPE